MNLTTGFIDRLCRVSFAGLSDEEIIMCAKRSIRPPVSDNLRGTATDEIPGHGGGGDV